MKREEGVFTHQCSNCNLTEWIGVQIPLELDHIDGNNKNNRLENLHLLCPNCHALTPTYRGKNKKRAKKELTIKQKEYKDKKLIEKTRHCKCGKVIYRDSITCKKCRVNKTKINWPTVEELLERLKTSNFTQLGKELGVTDNAIRKRIKNGSTEI